MMRIVFLMFIAAAAYGQEERLISVLKPAETAPESLLSSKSAVLFDNSYKPEELNKIQAAFQQIGIDADFYFDAGKVLAGIDTERAYATYFTTREVKFLLFLTKGADGFTFHATEFNKTMQFVTAGQIAWKVTDRRLEDMLSRIYRDSWLREKKQNFLINEIPEMDIVVPIITGTRAERYPIDLRIDKIAIQKVEDHSIQAEIDTLLKKYYPYPDKYQVVQVPADDKDLVKQGFQFVMLYVKVSGRAAHELLGYDMNKTFATAYGSQTFPNGTPQVKTISAETTIYKIYIKHLRSGNVFLGTKWDADEDLVQAMKNHLKQFRVELKLD
ncbi:MAG: hypothetical protein WDO14_10960 [Bacteroidota bacterium]